VRLRRVSILAEHTQFFVTHKTNAEVNNPVPRIAISGLQILAMQCYDFYISAKGEAAMIVNSTEVQNNFGKYLELAARQEIVITKNGQAVARLLGADKAISFLSDRLVGVIPGDVDEGALKGERLLRQ
jgi:prevent-host-death family protein